MTKQTFKTIEGIEVSLDNETGKFYAKVGGREIKRNSLSEIEKEIRKTKTAVEAYSWGYYQSTPHKPDIVAIASFDKDGRPRFKDGSLGRRREDFYILTSEDLSQIFDFVMRQEELEEEWRSLLESLQGKKLDRNNIESLRNIQSIPKPNS